MLETNQEMNYQAKMENCEKQIWETNGFRKESREGTLEDD